GQRNASVIQSPVPDISCHTHGISRTRLVAAVLAYSPLVLFTGIFLGPFLWMVSTSLKQDSQIFTETVRLIPRPTLWTNYPRALESFPFWLYLRNTLFVCVMTTIGTVLSAALPAYGFSRVKWRCRGGLFVLVL